MILREGYPFIIPALLLALAVLYFAGGSCWPILILPIYVTAFFRNPARLIPTDEQALLSPADGKVIEVRTVDESRILKRPAQKISIFMSPLDVHVNRIPCNGQVREIFYNPGKKFSAFNEKASLLNEQNVILLESETGQEILFIQIAGFLARRIVCYLKQGDRVVKGERFGLIRFGSRMDLYLPMEMKVETKVGDRARGGETILARFP